MKSKVIGISGFARSGKDTVALHIIGSDFGILKYSFADPLKEAVSKLFNIPLLDLYEGDREVELPEWGLSVRQILQRFGTESMRNNFGDNFWIKKAQVYVDNLSGDQILVIPDVRFENEADFCRDNGILIHVERPDADGVVGDANHASESGIQFQNGDYHINNNGSLEELYTQVDIILQK